MAFGAYRRRWVGQADATPSSLAQGDLDSRCSLCWAYEPMARRLCSAAWCQHAESGRPGRFLLCAECFGAFRTRARPVQGELGHRLGQHIAMLLLQLLVEVLHREVRVLIPKQPPASAPALSPAPASAKVDPCTGPPTRHRPPTQSVPFNVETSVR